MIQNVSRLSIPFVFPTIGGWIYHQEMNNWRQTVKNKITDRGESVGTVADRLGMTEGGLRHWLNGTRTPSIDQFLDLCAKLGLNPCSAIGHQLMKLDCAKCTSPVVKQTLNAKPQANANHKAFTDKVRAFRSAARRAKAHR